MSESAEMFNTIAIEYDKWYDENQNIFQSELAAIKKVFPEYKEGVEIGVGSGRFANALNIHIGVDPSREMAKIAVNKGISVIIAEAGNLPFADFSFDFALFVTSICFISDLNKAFNEAYRILKPSGEIIIGFIDKCGKLGTMYEQQNSGVYSYAHFYSPSEVQELLEKSGFSNFSYYQTLFDIDSTNFEQPETGYGQGSFVVLKGIKM